MSKMSTKGDLVDHVTLETLDVKIYHLHTPFQPPPTTRHNMHLPEPERNALGKPDKKFVIQETDLGRSPGRTTCFSCHQLVLTEVNYKPGVFAWLMCFLFIFCGLVICCCLIPFFVKTFKDVYHTCPRCRQILHVKKRSCC